MLTLDILREYDRDIAIEDIRAQMIQIKCFRKIEALFRVNRSWSQVGPVRDMHEPQCGVSLGLSNPSLAVLAKIPAYRNDTGMALKRRYPIPYPF